MNENRRALPVQRCNRCGVEGMPFHGPVPQDVDQQRRLIALIHEQNFLIDFHRD